MPLPEPERYEFGDLTLDVQERRLSKNGATMALPPKAFDVVWATKTLELDPRHLVAREHLAGAYWAMGDYDQHIAESVKHAESHGVQAEFLDRLKGVYAAAGRPGVVRWVLDTQTDTPPAFQRALLYGELGDLDEALRYLEQAIDAHEPCLVEIGVAPQWDPLRADPRFQRCLVRMGLGAPERN